MWVLSMNIKFKKVFGIALLICVLIPIIIHFCFKIECNNTIFVSTWKSGDMLQYCGTVLAALIAIIGVYLTLDDNRNKNEQNMILNVRPYLNTKIKGYECIDFALTDMYSSSDVACWFDCGASICFSLDPESINSELEEKVYCDCESNRQISNCFIFSYKITNIGLGPAMQLHLKINNQGVYLPLDLQEKDCLSLYIMISKQLFLEDKYKATLELLYNDILS